MIPALRRTVSTAWAVAGVTVRGGLRGRVVVLVGLYLLLFPLVGILYHDADASIWMGEAGSFLFRAAGILLLLAAIAAGATDPARERVFGIHLGILSKPVSRPGVLLGKWLGWTAVFAAVVVAMALVGGLLLARSARARGASFEEWKSLAAADLRPERDGWLLRFGSLPAGSDDLRVRARWFNPPRGRVALTLRLVLPDGTRHEGSAVLDRGRRVAEWPLPRLAEGGGATGGILAAPDDLLDRRWIESVEIVRVRDAFWHSWSWGFATLLVDVAFALGITLTLSVVTSSGMALCAGLTACLTAASMGLVRDLPVMIREEAVEEIFNPTIQRGRLERRRERAEGHDHDHASHRREGPSVVEGVVHRATDGMSAAIRAALPDFTALPAGGLLRDRRRVDAAGVLRYAGGVGGYALFYLLAGGAVMARKEW